jgi:ParB family chromosome partitioning protein
MTHTQPRLGRGLDALIPGGNPSGTNSRGDRLAVGRIKHNPYQPRKRFDDDELSQLRESIKSHGVLQPLVVRKLGDDFQLIAGERRLRAAQAAGLNEVPVHVVEFNDQQVFEAALVENIQRSDLNAVEKAQGFKEYLDKFQMTHEQLGSKLGLDRTTISNLLGLLNLPGEVQEAVRLGQISLGHAKVIKGLTDAARQVALCKETIMKGFSVHALEQLVKQQRQDAPPAAATDKLVAAPVVKTAHVAGLETELQQKLACRVEIRLKGKDKGQIVVGFESNDDFERVLEILRK